MLYLTIPFSGAPTCSSMLISPPTVTPAPSSEGTPLKVRSTQVQSLQASGEINLSEVD